MNLLTPFRRDRKRDFAVGSGAELLRAKVLQALLTEGATARTAGELPWRTNFGSALPLLRHGRSAAAMADVARLYVRDAIARWVPGAQLLSVDVTRDGPMVILGMRVREGAVETTVETRFVA